MLKWAITSSSIGQWNRCPPATQAKYGRMRLHYPQDHRFKLYVTLLMEVRLFAHLLDVEDTANAWLDRMMPEMAKSAGATEKLKARDQKARV